MVGTTSKSSKLSYTDIIIAGSVSGSITRGICQPFDVLKIRLQLQVEPISEASLSKYRSLVQAVAVIHQEEGIKAFWKGHIPAQLLSIVYGSAQFWCFETLSKFVHSKTLDKSYEPIVNFLCGAVAGGMATLVSFPFDVIRTRLVAQSEQFKAYSGVLNAFNHIYINEGFVVLFRGLTPTIIQVAPHAGVQFMTYKMVDNLYRKIVNIEHSNYSFLSSVLAGSFAGLCAKTAIYPLDLTRKRMQIQGFKANRKCFGKSFICKGMVDCLQKIYEVEGFSGLFKGLSPSLIKAVVTSALHFSTYELICELIYSNYK